MSCMLYIRWPGAEKWLGKFPSRKAAEEYYKLYQRQAPKGAIPIYVQSGKGRGTNVRRK